MWKKLLPLMTLPLLVAGCATSFTNLTPKQQLRNDNGSYPVEVAFKSTQQNLMWDTIQPKIVVGSDSYPMRPTPLMTNRWEGLLPVPTGNNIIHYRYRFDFLDNGFRKTTADNAVSQEYTLRILEHQ
jgi:hypothetical protein